MAYTSYSQEWLEDSTTAKIILVEVVTGYDSSGTGTSYLDTTLLFGSSPYLTQDGLSQFLPNLTGDLSISESININGDPNLSVSDIQLRNSNGELDQYLDRNYYLWSYKSVKVYLGDPFWSSSSLADMKTKFLKIFDGVIDDVDSKNRFLINIKIRNKLDRLNYPVTEDKLGTAYGVWSGGSSQNADIIKPLVFGEIHNYSPLLIDPSQLEYMFNNGEAEQLVEARDNGVPIYTTGQTLSSQPSVDNVTGKLKLNSALAGVLTCSVQGVKKSVTFDTVTGVSSLAPTTYSSNLNSIIALLITQYGNTNNKLDLSEIDATSFAQSNLAKPVGCIVNDRTNVLILAKSLLASVGAQLFANSEGKVQLIQYGVGLPGTFPITQVTSADMLFGSLNLSSTLPVQGAIKLGYAKNYSVQNNLLTAIPEEHKTSFATEWWTYTAIDTVTVTNYKLEADPPQTDTHLITLNDVTTEANRRLAFYKNRKQTFRFDGTSKCLSIKVGQPLTVIHNRFNLYNSGNGVTGQVVSVNKNWMKQTVSIEVII